MQRDPRLRSLSSEHHTALVLARRLVSHAGVWTATETAALRERFDRELEPHFRVEEDVLLPALREAGRADLADRTQRDHEALRALVAALASADADPTLARRIGELLRDHVRFEEQELFPSCEALLPDVVLERLPRHSIEH
ncbi:MAG TPA: hemerythrin domain-containing protein [Polyangiales bacterium]|nr:hemerythrin domain-containing protein [Polyangiales bacterium]